MKIFNLFKSLINKKFKKRKPAKSTVAFDAYRNALISNLQTIEIFSESEVVSIADEIVDFYNGPQDQSFFKKIFLDHFSGKTWHWPEYDKWNAIFTKAGKFPTSWIDQTRGEYCKSEALEEIITHMSKRDMQAVMRDMNLVFDEKLKKDDLKRFAMTNDEFINSSFIKEKLLESKKRFDKFSGYGLYEILMRTISYRAKSLHDLNRFRDMGISEYRIRQFFDEDAAFTAMALKENPEALPPMFPYDQSRMVARIPGLDDLEDSGDIVCKVPRE